jgi:hypothetical protein
MPRPIKLTKAVQSRILAAASTGNTRRTMALHAGISERTLYDWIHRGEMGDPEFLQFLQSLRAAETEAEMHAVAMWQSAMPDSWQACRDFLARRFPADWGPRDRHEITGAEGGPITIAELAVRAREAQEADDVA